MPEQVSLDFLGELRRTHTCGQLRSSDVGNTALLMGWVHRRRDLGGVFFIHLRDRDGVTQIVFHADAGAELHAKAEMLGSEYVVAVEGTVAKRAPETINAVLDTGEVELVATRLWILNESRTPPFPMEETVDVKEDARLKYRYVDLRRPHMQRNIMLRSKISFAVREFLYSQGFLEIETPFMGKSTPEGARDYLVPSRVQPGSFYALPQSPQIYKQLLMVSGYEKYFQIARCFRDEDLRADRQPEFTQIDLEMSFPQQEKVFRVVEGFLTAAFKTASISLTTPFVQMTYDDAIKNYGIDKPDMRLPAMVSLTDELTVELRESLKIEKQLPVLGFVIPKAGALSGTQKRGLVDEIRASFGDCGLDFLDVARLKTNAAFALLAETIETKLKSDTSDLVIVITPKIGAPVKWNHDPQWIYKRVCALRLELAKNFSDKHRLFEQTGTAADFKFLWVTDFPMYEWDEETKVWNAAHHPFTSPHEEDIKAGRLTSDKGAVRALAYDIVLNGTELGSGSIRIHRQDVQAEIFRSLGMSDAEAKERFGFFLDALEYGTPPHGGIALGLDRIVMILAGATSLREVIAFPKTAKAIDLMVDAPTPVSDQQMRELHLKTVVRS